MFDMPISEVFIIATLMTAIAVGALVWTVRDQDQNHQL
jgi:hypothetical protein